MNPVSRPLLSTAIALLAASAGRAAPTPILQLSTVAANGYSADDINAVAVARNTLVSDGIYQYVAYYGTAIAGVNPIYIGRRTLGTTAWATFQTNLSVGTSTNSNATDVIGDDHNVVSIAIDGDGYLHAAWGCIITRRF